MNRRAVDNRTGLNTDGWISDNSVHIIVGLASVPSEAMLVMLTPQLAVHGRTRPLML